MIDVYTSKGILVNSIDLKRRCKDWNQEEDIKIVDFLEDEYLFILCNSIGRNSSIKFYIISYKSKYEMIEP